MALTIYDPKISWSRASVAEDFSKIPKFCPSSILERVKRSKSMCHDPAANNFWKLDNIIKIDKDDETIKSFSDTVFRCVEAIGKCIQYSLHDFGCTVIPAGSFPLNLKIEAIDEFDFVLILESQKKSYKMDDLVELLAFREKHDFADIIEDILREFHCVKLFCEMNLFQKYHAVNIIMSWVCYSNHKHSLSLDMALGLKTTTTAQEFFERSNFHLKGTPFTGLIDMNDNMCWFCRVDNYHDGRVDTKLFDKQLFEKCSIPKYKNYVIELLSLFVLILSHMRLKVYIAGLKKRS